MARRGTSRGVWVSIAVHVLFFGSILLMIAWKKMHKEPDPMVFELVDPTPMQEQQDTPPTPEPVEETPTDPAEETPLIDAPQFEPTEDVRIPELNIPEPEPEPEPTPPEPKPEPKPTPKPQPKPEPPKPQPKTMSLAEFRKQHGQPTPQPKPKPKPTAAPQIKVDKSALRVSGSSTSVRQSTVADQKAMDAFIARLRRQIELAWQKPDIDGYEISAVVSVTVQPNGTFSPVRITTSSGNSVFDSSIVNAVKRARNIGGPPTGEAVTVTYTFRLLDR